MHHFPGQRNTFQRQGFWVAYFRSFSHDRHSPGRDTTAQSCRFSCFFCAAYGLLLTQTRTQCSNSASRAIAMLEKSAKISPNAWAVVSLPDEHGHAENSYIFANDLVLAFGACGLSAHTTLINMAIATHVEQTICTDQSPSSIKVQISPLVIIFPPGFQQTSFSSVWIIRAVFMFFTITIVMAFDATGCGCMILSI